MQISIAKAQEGLAVNLICDNILCCGHARKREDMRRTACMQRTENSSAGLCWNTVQCVRALAPTLVYTGSCMERALLKQAANLSTKANVNFFSILTKAMSFCANFPACWIAATHEEEECARECAFDQTWPTDQLEKSEPTEPPSLGT